MPDSGTLTKQENLPALPPVIAGAFTPEVQSRVDSFFHSVAAIFEAWVNRRNSEHTRRAYRGDVMAFVEFRGWTWPEDAARLLRASILDVQAFKDHMARHGGAPKTINRRISSLRFHLKGNRYKTKGLHFSAAESIAEYIKASGIESGPLFRPRVSPYKEELAPRRMTQRSMCRLLMSYLERLPEALREKELPSGEKIQECIYSPHSLRARTATLLLDSSVAIESVQDLLDHKHITATQIYDKRRRSVRDSVSHKVPI